MTADLVVFGEDWGRHPTSSQALAAELARDRRVLWVNSVGLRRPRLADAGRVVAKLRAAAAPPPAAALPVPAQGPAAIVAPLAVPFPGAALARRANAVLWRRGVGKRAAALGLSRPILWLGLPTAIDARHALDHRALVYYCGDDFGALAGVDHAPVLALERELAAVADLVVVSHRRLAAKFPPEKVLFLPHGVSAARFSGAGAPPPGPPVAGYLGLIDGRTDFEALAQAARALPGWRFVLAGPVAAEAAGAVARLARQPNVTLSGPVPPAEVPALLAGWTAGLLPYRDTPMTRACDPLKLREYLAAGLPVAAFPFAAGLPHGDLFTLCPPDALAATLDALAAEPEGRRAARRAAMAGEDWAVRARVLSDALERLG